MTNAPLLQIDDLHVTFQTPLGPVRAVRGVSLDIAEGEILGVVGESGCGKSVTFRSLLGLMSPATQIQGRVEYRGQPIDTAGALRSHASLIYQNPGAALNPVFTIGEQLQLVAPKSDRDQLADMLDQVGLPDPKRSLSAYPHELSGGMRQRAVIAFALAQSPELLIADEPTTALDVTTQAQVLDLIAEIRDRANVTVVLVSHDLGVIKKVCDRVAVLYAGKVVEVGATDQTLNAPLHPYTDALLASTPGPHNVGQELPSIHGMVPDGRAEITGCSFAPRCPHASEQCHHDEPSMRSLGSTGQSAACVLVEPGS